jgi:UDP:flavonoid glycosyltransferase YjiC (YdhE family)
MPWGIDQFFNGDRVARIGAGQWISRDRCPPDRIARVLRALLTEERYRERAQTIAAAIAREDGVGALCNAIEALPPLRRRVMPPRIADFALPIAAGE